LIALYILKTKSGIEKAKRNYLETSIIDSILIFCNAHGFSTKAVEMGTWSEFLPKLGALVYLPGILLGNKEYEPSALYLSAYCK